ncbi:glycosyl hydrolase [Pontiella desulfatans]|nr:glycosyl hydrolase [Pontiella desulfatans]
MFLKKFFRWLVVLVICSGGVSSAAILPVEVNTPCVGNGVFTNTCEGVLPVCGMSLYGTGSAMLGGRQAGVVYARFSELSEGNALRAGTYRLEMFVAGDGSRNWPGARNMFELDGGSGFALGFFTQVDSTGGSPEENARITLNNMVDFNNTPGVAVSVEQGALFRPGRNQKVQKGMWHTVSVIWDIAPNCSLVGMDPFVGLGFEVENGAIWLDDAKLTYHPPGPFGGDGKQDGPRTRKSLARILGEYPELSALMGAEWYYNWGAFPGPVAPPNIEFVPMIWGIPVKNDGSVDAGLLRKNVSRTLAANPDCKVLLGFNEPNHKFQSNRTLEQVLDAWPILQEAVAGTDIRLGSPGEVMSGDWMRSFMREAGKRGYQVDILCVHQRINLNKGVGVDAVLKRFKKWHEEFGLPIWITELELIGDNLTEDRVIAFWEEWADRLENDPSMKGVIERYAMAYAPPDTDIDYKIPARPYSWKGTLTDFGRAFQRLHRK